MKKASRETRSRKSLCFWTQKLPPHPHSLLFVLLLRDAAATLSMTRRDARLRGPELRGVPFCIFPWNPWNGPYVTAMPRCRQTLFRPIDGVFLVARSLKVLRVLRSHFVLSTSDEALSWPYAACRLFCFLLASSVCLPDNCAHVLLFAATSTKWAWTATQCTIALCSSTAC